MCPTQFVCLVLIISIFISFFFNLFNTSSFVLCSVQLILSILLHIHISKASIPLTSAFLIVHVSAPFSVTLHTSDLTIFFLMSLLNPPFNNSFLLVNASFPSLSFSLFHCGILHQAFQVAECSDLFYFLSVDCYFYILLFFFFYPAYLHYFCFLGINFHSIFCSCLVQSKHHFLQVVLFTITWSSANRSAFISFPPTVTPSSESCSFSD